MTDALSETQIVSSATHLKDFPTEALSSLRLLLVMLYFITVQNWGGRENLLTQTGTGCLEAQALTLAQGQGGSKVNFQSILSPFPNTDLAVTEKHYKAMHFLAWGLYEQAGYT